MNKRDTTHLVLIPGFFGFDALGQLEYYAGLTPVFRKWLQSSGRNDIVIHYFDNFPTASVGLRALRLQNYLAQRCARGEFSDNDKLVLIGHSTGGLDIRRLICNLARDEGASCPKDGFADMDQLTPKASDILTMIKGIVFVSVPQCGMNLANWIADRWLARMALIDALRVSLDMSQVPPFDKLEYSISSIAARSDFDLVLAARDALGEVEPVRGNHPLANAMAQEAASELALWLRHIATDFRVIQDLSAITPKKASAMSGQELDRNESPAHFSDEAREIEKAYWRKFQIQARSYVTVSPSPTDVSRAAKMDAPYKAFYKACTKGPFCLPDKSAASQILWGLGEPPDLLPSTNDGIVNTASMMWPNDTPTFVVGCDHMDIVGHFHRVLAKDKRRRIYDAYDLLRSGSDFDDAAFSIVWNDIFEFCLTL